MAKVVREGTVVLSTPWRILLYEVPFPGHLDKKEAIRDKYVYVLHEPGAPDKLAGKVSLVDKLFAMGDTWLRFHQQYRTTRVAWWSVWGKHFTDFDYRATGYQPARSLLNGNFYFFLSPLQLGPTALTELIKATERDIDRDRKGQVDWRWPIQENFEKLVTMAKTESKDSTTVVWWDDCRASASTRARFDLSYKDLEASKWRHVVALRDPFRWCEDLSTGPVAWAGIAVNKYWGDAGRLPRRFIAFAIDAEIRCNKRTGGDKGLEPYLMSVGLGWWKNPAKMAERLGWPHEGGRVVRNETEGDLKYYVAVPKQDWNDACQRATNAADLYMRLDDLRFRALDKYKSEWVSRLDKAIHHPSTMVLRTEWSDAICNQVEDPRVVNAESQSTLLGDLFWVNVLDPLTETTRGRMLLTKLADEKHCPLTALKHLERKPSADPKYYKKWFDVGIKRWFLPGLKLAQIYVFGCKLPKELQKGGQALAQAQHGAQQARQAAANLKAEPMRRVRAALLDEAKVVDRIVGKRMEQLGVKQWTRLHDQITKELELLEQGKPLPERHHLKDWYNEVQKHHDKLGPSVADAEQKLAQAERKVKDVEAGLQHLKHTSARAKARAEALGSAATGILKTVDTFFGVWTFVEARRQRKGLQRGDIRTACYAAEAASEFLAAGKQWRDAAWQRTYRTKLAGMVGAVLDVYLTGREIGSARDPGVKWGYGIQTVAAAAGLVGSVFSVAGVSLAAMPGVGLFIYGTYLVGYMVGIVMTMVLGYPDWKEATKHCFLGLDPQGTLEQQQKRWMQVLTSFDVSMDGNELRITPGVLTDERAYFKVRWLSGGQRRDVSVWNWRTGIQSKATPQGSVKHALVDGKIRLITDATAISWSQAEVALLKNAVAMKPLTLKYDGAPGFTTDYAKPV